MLLLPQYAQWCQLSAPQLSVFSLGGLAGSPIDILNQRVAGVGGERSRPARAVIVVARLRVRSVRGGAGERSGTRGDPVPCVAIVHRACAGRKRVVKPGDNAAGRRRRRGGGRARRGGGRGATRAGAARGSS